MQDEDVTCLGIESTAHTFGCSVVELLRDEAKILSDIAAVYVPQPGAGIHPREASQHHSTKGAAILRQALKEANLTVADLDCIAFSAGPGLGPCLRVGAVIARSLSTYFNKPLVPINHAAAHIELASMLTGALDPLVLLVSGGHTLITAFSKKRWRIFGETLDLTIGQLIDQFGRNAGFSSPAGPRIEALARGSSNYVTLPYRVKGNDISLSGILTAAKKALNTDRRLEDLCYSIQETAFAMLAEVTERALAFVEKDELLLVGGVAANRRLQSMLEDVAIRHEAQFLVVPKHYSGDCGAQIAWNGAIAYRVGIKVDVGRSVVNQSWRLDEVISEWRD